MARPNYEPGAELGTALLEGLPIGVYRTSPEGRVLAANSALLRMLGYASLEELSSRDLNREFEPGYIRSEFRQALERDGEVVGLESLWTRKDGSSFYARENARAVRDGADSVLYFEGTVEDVTSRRRVEEECQALLEIVQGLNATYDLDELFSLIHRAVGRVLYAENFLIALYNLETGFLHFEFFVDKHDPTPPPRPLGKGLSGYVINNDKPLLLSHEDMQRMVEMGMVEGVIGTFSASWLGVPLRTPNGAIGVLVVQHYEEEHVYAEGDVEFLTSVAGQVAVAIERRRAEVALRRSEAELKKFAAKLEASNRELQDFAYVASHDLQEPLRKIQAFGDRLKTKYARRARRQGKRLPRADAERGRPDADADQRPAHLLAGHDEGAAVRHRSILAEVGGGCRLRPRGAHRADRRARRGRRTADVDADPLQMRQLLQNLIGNGLKFHKPDEPPLVKVWCERVASNDADAKSAGGGICRLFVEDNGIGFDEKYSRPHLHSLPAAPRPPRVRGDGHGARHLPQDRRAARRERHRRERARPRLDVRHHVTYQPAYGRERLMSASARPITILMADDDADDRMMASEALEESRLANDLRFVEDGEELLDYLYRRGKLRDPRRVAAAGPDPARPEHAAQDGREALREIKADPALRRIPVVVLTTSKAEEDIYRTYDLGVNSFITKPVHVRGAGRGDEDARQVLARDRGAARRGQRLLRWTRNRSASCSWTTTRTTTS